VAGGASIYGREWKPSLLLHQSLYARTTFRSTMSNTKSQTGPEVVTLPRTGSAERAVRSQSIVSLWLPVRRFRAWLTTIHQHSSLNDRGSAETTDKAREGDDVETGRKPVEEGFVYEPMKANNPRSFIRRHWFVIAASIVAILVVGLVVGVLLVKVILSGPKSDPAIAGGQYVTTTDPSGGLHTTFLPNAVRPFVSTFANRRSPLLKPRSSPALSLHITKVDRHQHQRLLREISNTVMVFGFRSRLVHQRPSRWRPLSSLVNDFGSCATDDRH
jgi:hypothetical protein